MMKHDSIMKPLPLTITKEGVKKSLWKSKSSSETASTPKSPITKAFDFLPWSRSKKLSGEKLQKTKADSLPPQPTTNRGNSTTTNTATTTSTTTATTTTNVAATNSVKDKKDERNLFRNIINEKITQSDEKVHKRSNIRRIRQVTGRNKSLDINELINCVEREISANNSPNGRHRADSKTQRFLDDTFIENIMRAKEAYQHNIQLANEQEDDEESEYYCNNRLFMVDCNDTEDEYFYEQQQKLAQLCKHADPRRYSTTPTTNGTNNGSISPKHILFNDQNTVYLIKKELPVNKSMEMNTETLKNCDKKQKHMESVLKARLKFKKLSSDNNSEHDAKSFVLNNNRVIANTRHTPAVGKRSILQRQNTNPEQYNCLAHTSSPDNFRKRSPSASRYQTTSSRYSPGYQRRKSLTDGANYDHVNSSLQYDKGNSSTSSMGSGVSTNGGILNDRPKTDKPRKKLSFREPIVAGKRSMRHQNAETVSVSTNGLSVQMASALNNSNCDSNRDSRRTTPTNDSITAQEDLNKSQAMRIVRTVGQAFEVCHKFNIHKNSLDNNDERSDISSSELLDVENRSDQQLSDDDGHKKAHTPELNLPQRPNHLELVPQTNISKAGSFMVDEDKSPTTPSSPSREINKLKDQLEQQAMQTRQALAQLMLVREQLISETNARIEAQARTQQLLQQNRELLEHLASLGAYTEQQTPGLTSANIGMAPQLSSTAKVARWFQQLPWHTASLSRPESGFVSGDSRSEKFQDDQQYFSLKDTDDLCDEFLLVEGSSTIWTKLSAKKRRKLLGMRLGKVTTF